MNITVNGRHFDVTPAIKSYAEDKIGKFDRYLTNITEAIVTLSIQKHRHKAEVLIKANGYLIQAESVTEEVYSAIDGVVEKIERQVKKHKEKIVSRRRDERAGEAPEAAAPSEAPKIIKRKKFDMKPMNVEEAALQMELLDKVFFVFSNETSGAINVLYRRNDGNLGLIEPSPS